MGSDFYFFEIISGSCQIIFWQSKMFNVILHPQFKQCPGGGTGRRARLKIWFSQGSAGSIPVSGTSKACKLIYL